MRKGDRAGRNFLCVVYLSPINMAVISRKGKGDLRRRAGVSVEGEEAGMEAEACAEENRPVWRSMEGKEEASFLFIYAPVSAVSFIS